MTNDRLTPVILCIGFGNSPYWACTTLGGTIRHTTKASLQKQLNFVYGVGRWVEVDVRLANEISDIPANAVISLFGQG